MASITTTDGEIYNLIRYEPWHGAGTGIGTTVGSSWAYILQRQSDGLLLGFVINYPFTVGSNIHPDDVSHNMKLIKIALNSDPENVIRQARSKQFVIEALQDQYSAVA